VLEAQRDQRFAQLRAEAARPDVVTPLQQQLGDLLRDRRSPFDDAPFGEVLTGRARERQRIHSDMRMKPPVFRGQRRVDEDGRQRRRVQRLDARAVGRQRFVQHASTSIDDHPGCRADPVEQPRGQGAASQPDEAAEGDRRQPQNDTADPWRAKHFQHLTAETRHGGGTKLTKIFVVATVGAFQRYFFTSITAVAVRPNTSGSYISSACAGAVRKVPAVVARAM
jgi:hypothetical protein